MSHRLLLNKELYGQNAILDAIKAFNTICRVNISEDEVYYRLEFENAKCDLQTLMDEFQNYVLITTIKSMGNLYD